MGGVALQASQLIAGVMWTMGFMILVSHTAPYVLDFADALKTAVDAAVLSTLILSIVLKLDDRLAHERINASGIAE